jgi:thioester reductase-like protein
MKKVVFLTGATGLIGSNLVFRILRDDPATGLVLLVRGDSDSDAQNRLEGILGMWSSENDLDQTKKRIRVITGDVTLSRLGLSRTLYTELASQTTHVIHSAATVQFGLPLECARLVNLGGTKNVMALARRAKQTGSLQRAAYVSTAYTCGDRSGTIFEDELDCGQKFDNTYEQTKFESEKFVRRLMAELPVTVFRPSTVVGDSKTGKTTAFNVLYPPLKLICRGALRILPGSPYTSLDVVPVDFVADAINHILFNTYEGIGKTYHLAAGEQSSPTTGEIVDLAIEYFNQTAIDQHILPVEFVPLESYRALRRFARSNGNRILQAMEVYEPYLCVQRTFDIANTRSALRGTNITPPQFRVYYQNMLRYCIETDWGKRLMCAA